jgi:hypothetical protein
MALDPTIPLGVKPIDFLGSAGNLLNLARGAQALEQEQTLNPIQAEKARIELGIARDTQAAEIARLKARSGQEVTAEQVARFNQSGNTQQRLIQNFAPLANLPSFENPAANPQAAIRDVMSAKEQAIASGVPADQAEFLAASLYAKLAEAKDLKDSGPVKNWLWRNIVSIQTPSDIRGLVAPAGAPNVTSAAGVPGYAVPRPSGIYYQPLKVGPPPTAPTMGAPLSEGVETGAIQTPQTIIQRTQVGESGLTPPVSPGLAAVSTPMQPAAPVQPQGVTAEMMAAPSAARAGAIRMPDLPYPVRPKEGGFFFQPNEEADQKSGREYVTALTSQQPDLTVNKENLSRVANLATKIEKDLAIQSGPLSVAQRGVEAFFGNPQYKELSKLLANVRLSMLKAGGSSLGTDAGKDLVALSQGTEMYDPRLLTKIARETMGNVLQKEGEGVAANAFVQRYGPQNHNAFKQVWSSNADPKVFEMLAAEKLFPADKNRRLDAYNSILEGVPDKSDNPNVDTKAKLLEKYKAIKALMQSGSL